MLSYPTSEESIARLNHKAGGRSVITKMNVKTSAMTTAVHQPKRGTVQIAANDQRAPRDGFLCLSVFLSGPSPYQSIPATPTHC
jgi:hypothetical protein